MGENGKSIKEREKMLPKDPVMLLSVINTKLRDEYSSLDILCEELQISRTELEDALRAINYEYNEETNQFV